MHKRGTLVSAAANQVAKGAKKVRVYARCTLSIELRDLCFLFL